MRFFNIIFVKKICFSYSCFYYNVILFRLNKKKESGSSDDSSGSSGGGGDKKGPEFDQYAMIGGGLVAALVTYSYLLYSRNGTEITWKDFVNK